LFLHGEKGGKGQMGLSRFLSLTPITVFLIFSFSSSSSFSRECLCASLSLSQGAAKHAVSERAGDAGVQNVTGGAGCDQLQSFSSSSSFSCESLSLSQGAAEHAASERAGDAGVRNIAAGAGCNQLQPDGHQGQTAPLWVVFLLIRRWLIHWVVFLLILIRDFV
jgi:hypothetical protein